MFNTPILFLIFNRPDTTRKVFAKIREVKPKKFFIAADGPRSNIEDEKEKCEAARAIINNIDWDCEIKTLFNIENKGCGKSVSDAISWFFKFENEGIILEDDCLPSMGFFKYCEVMLDRYRNESRVFHIGGNNFQFGKKWGKGDYYFSTLSHIWGWATWKRAWSNYQFNIANIELISDKFFKDAFNNNGAVNYFKDIFSKVANHEIDTWDYQWLYTIIKNKGLSICPNTNLVKNIGFRNDATHTVEEPEWNKEITAQDLYSFLPPCHFKIEHKADNLTLKNIFKIDKYVKSGKDFEKTGKSKIKRDLKLFYQFTRFLKFIKNRIIRVTG